MIISDEVKGNSLIGEATINLIFNREEVTLNTLLIQLEFMAEKEAGLDKRLMINEVRSWLMSYFSKETFSIDKSNWLESALAENGESNSLPPIHSVSSLDD
ncbi:hypothetical protein [Rouxiella sp. WC2420]|uniref:Uncharacterized protein n=1 Tax=Rouxiella sp. WC2420 TaxID=3234145 RepID=A0AB39VKH6_9GAMM